MQSVQRGQDHTLIHVDIDMYVIITRQYKLNADKNADNLSNSLGCSHVTFRLCLQKEEFIAVGTEKYAPYLRRVCGQYRDVFLRDIYVEYTWWLLWWTFDLAADEDFGERTEWIKRTSEVTSRARRKALRK